MLVYILTVSRFLARGWIADVLDRPCHGAGHLGRLGWGRVDQALISSSFLKPGRKIMKSPETNVEDSRGLSQLVSIPDCFLLNHSEAILKSFLTILILHLIWHSSNLQSVGRRFTVGLLGPRAVTRTATSRADGERAAFNLCVYIICADTLRMGNWKWVQP